MRLARLCIRVGRDVLQTYFTRSSYARQHTYIRSSRQRASWLLTYVPALVHWCHSRSSVLAILATLSGEDEILSKTRLFLPSQMKRSPTTTSEAISERRGRGSTTTTSGHKVNDVNTVHRVNRCRKWGRRNWYHTCLAKEQPSIICSLDQTTGSLSCADMKGFPLMEAAEDPHRIGHTACSTHGEEDCG